MLFELINFITDTNHRFKNGLNKNYYKIIPYSHDKLLGIIREMFSYFYIAPCKIVLTMTVILILLI